MMRETTERPEAVSAGTVKLVGTNQQLIVDSVNKLLNSKDEYETQLKYYIYCWLDNCKDKISFKNL